jgi:hypothetical protein
MIFSVTGSLVFAEEESLKSVFITVITVKFFNDPQVRKE